MQGDYTLALDLEATWFVDPPYQVQGRCYRHKFDQFRALGEWALELPGVVIVCEQDGADWLPFPPLADVKSTRGTSREVAYISDQPDAIAAVLFE